MRLYRRDAFLALPPGVCFCKGERWAFSAMRRKGDSIPLGAPIDFYFQPLAWIDADSSAEQWDLFERILAQGTSAPLSAYEQRDGCFDDDALFLVYEDADLLALQTIIETAIQVSRRQTKENP